MQAALPSRRLLLKTGLALAALGAAGGASLWWRRGIVDLRLSDDGRDVIRATARGVLSEILPTEAGARDAALDAHIARVDAYLAAIAPASRQQLSLLLGALANLPTRVLVTGMASHWRDASDLRIQHALEHMRTASSMTNRSVYGILRELVCLTYFSVPQTWAVTGYPGPQDV